MLSIDDYVQEAKAKQNIPSNNQLSLRLGLSKGLVNAWLSRKAFPSDGAMVKLAEIGGKNVDKALLHLNWWRSVSKDEYDAAAHYKHLLESLNLAA